MLQRPVLRRTPREIDLPFLDRYALPFARKFEVGAIEPPDVFAVLIGELDLKVVDRRIGAQIKADFVIRRQVERQRTRSERVAGGSREIEVEAQRFSVD